VPSISSTIVQWSHTPGSVVAFRRMVAAAATWWVVLAVQHRRTAAPWPGASTWRNVLPSGLLFGANLATFFTAVTKTSVPHAEFIGALTPLLLVPPPARCCSVSTPTGARSAGERCRSLGWRS
jgi:drug/metabolite transporter (DMT)-like permease